MREFDDTIGVRVSETSNTRSRFQRSAPLAVCQTLFSLLLIYLLFSATMGNPVWDQNDIRNVQAMVAILGAHLVLNLVLMSMLYIITYFVMRLTGKISPRSCYEYKAVSCDRAGDLRAMNDPDEVVNLIEKEV